MMTLGKKYWWLALLLLVLLAGGAFWLLKNQALEAVKDENGAKVLLEVPRGSGVRQIGQLLADQGIIDSVWQFVLAARLADDLPGPLQAGEYELSPAYSIEQILNILARGQVFLYSLTVPEGFTLEQIIARLAELGLAAEAPARELAFDQEFLNQLGIQGPSLEGYLFPDTYFFPKSITVAGIYKAMTAKFETVWHPLAARAAEQCLSKTQAVILASIIEKEALVSAERPLISAVYHNRLKLNMPLQADPTVVYGLAGGLQGPLLRRHLRQDHAYNTYTRAGLPPGPICSPGRASLLAAVEPAQTDYLYFVAKGDGSHAFSRHYREQVKNIRLYRQKK